MGVAEWENTEFGTCSDTLFLNDAKKVRKVITVCDNCPADFSAFCGDTVKITGDTPAVTSTLSEIEANWGTDKMQDIWTQDAEIVWFTKATGGETVAVGYSDFSKVVTSFMKILNADKSFVSGFQYGDSSNAGVAAWQNDQFGSCSDTLILNAEGKARKCITVCDKCPAGFSDYCH